MGIPVYFKQIVTQYQDSILIKKKKDNINFLFLDLNCLIHPCCRGLDDEEKMIQKIIFEIERLIDYTNVSKLVYIAIDGIAPQGKMKQQRMRRFKSALERKYNNNILWNTNAISPGTFFMEKLNNSLRSFIENSNKNIILSDSNERGEGEHKILHYIKNNNLEGNLCIYGLDADLIQLSLVSNKDNIFLLRERTEYNIEDTDQEFIYLTIDKLKNHIIESLNLNKIIDKNKIINDYVFMCFLLGNDFMNHIPSLNLRYGGHELLLKIYSELHKKYQGYFYLIDEDINDIIFLPFFKEFIHELSKIEKENMMKILSIRERQYKKIKNEHYNDFQNFKQYINDNKYTNDKNITMEDIYWFQYNSTYDKINIEKMIENLPILYCENERQLFNNIKYDKNLCEDYFNSLVWTTHYYFKECINWRWCTKYNHSPLIENLNNYLNGINRIIYIRNNNEFTNIEQLSYIFPEDSHKLHKYTIKSDEYKMIPHLSFNRYLWECHLDFKN